MKNVRDGIHLLGTGILAEELFALAAHAGVQVTAFVENLDRAKGGGSLCGRPILWVDDLPAGASCLCALSTTKRRRFIEEVADRAVFATFVHPSAIVLPGTTLGEGTVISAGVIVASNTTLGRHVFVNRGARVGHHTRVGDFVTIQPGANVAGSCSTWFRTMPFAQRARAGSASDAACAPTLNHWNGSGSPSRSPLVV